MNNDNFLFEESMEFDIWLNENMTDVKMDIDMIALLTEAKEDDNESGNKFVKVAKRLAKMIATLIEQLKKYIEKAMKKIGDKIQSVKFKAAIKRVKLIKSSKPIKFVDVWKLEKEIKTEARELSLLCSSWSRSYAKKGKGVMAANKFEDAFNHIVRKHEEKIDQIKKTKENFPADKVRAWLLKNTNNKGEFFGILHLYIKDIEKSKALLAEIKEKKEMFIDREDYDNGPVTFSRVVHNSCNYVKRNCDWLGLFFISSVLQIGASAAKYSDLLDQEEQIMTDEHDEEKARIEKRVIANTIYKDSEYKSKKKSAAKAMKAASATTAAMGAYIKAKEKRKRNSI